MYLDLTSEFERANLGPSDEFGAFEPFIVLPNRIQYKDYYKVITHPISLRSLQKKVKGAIGRSAATGISEFKSWSAFETEASNIWKNAYIYNDDGSDIFVLAKELEVCFLATIQIFRFLTDFQSFVKGRIEQAKAVVPEPAGPKIKLKLPETSAPKITLKFGSKTASTESPVPQPSPHLNGTNGKAAPVALSPLAPIVNGNNGTSRQNPFRGSQSSGTPVPSLDQLEHARSVSGSVPSPTPSNSTLVKNEEAARNSPMPAGYNNSRGPSQAASTPVPAPVAMAPPSTPGLPNLYTQSGYAQSFNHQGQFQNPNPSFDSKWRQPGKSMRPSLIIILSADERSCCRRNDHKFEPCNSPRSQHCAPLPHGPAAIPNHGTAIYHHQSTIDPLLPSNQAYARSGNHGAPT